MAAMNGARASANGHISEGDTALLERAAVRRLHAREMTVERSVVGIVRADRATLAGSNAAVVVARSLACDEVHAAVIVAPVVRGEVHTWLDMRSAIAIGLGWALGRVLIAAVRALGCRFRR